MLSKKQRIFLKNKKDKKSANNLSINYAFLILGSILGFFMSISGNIFYDLFINKKYSIELFIWAVIIIILLSFIITVLDFMFDNINYLKKKTEKEFVKMYEYELFKYIKNNKYIQSLILILFILILIKIN